MDSPPTDPLRWGPADSPRGMQLPPPDLSAAYAQLPGAWRVGAVLLADRLLAAAYAEDIRQTCLMIRQDLESGAVKGMTVAEYLDDETAAHPRVIDRRRALDVLKYSPSVELPLPAEEDVPLPERARLLFRLDVAAALRAMGIAIPDEWVRDPASSVDDHGEEDVP